MAAMTTKCLGSRVLRAAPSTVCRAAVGRREWIAGGLAGAILLARPSSSVAAGEFITAKNGLQYVDTEVGTGPAPVKGSQIKCHYTGRLKSNGVKFDSSYDRRQPLAFTIGVGQVIKGWDVGILGNGDDIPSMKEGGKRTLIIPAELGYGARGAGNVIPPGAVLEFDVELLPRK